MPASKHTNEITPCPACEEKLIQAHPDLGAWFRTEVKPNNHDAHISWTFRDMQNQQQCFVMGKSSLPWPLSKHNKSDDQGNPCSLAIDLFRLCSNGMASWEWKYFKDIADAAKKSGAKIEWGGDWSKFKDSDHYQLSV